MGSWGYEPKDSDGAADLFIAAKDSTIQFLLCVYGLSDEWPRGSKRFAPDKRSARRPERRLERVGLLQELLEMGVAVPQKVIELAVEDMDAALAAHDDFGWKSPTIAKKTLTRIRSALFHLLTRSSHRIGSLQRIVPWLGWPKPEKPMASPAFIRGRERLFKKIDRRVKALHREKLPAAKRKAK
jgi:hypothetical protein